LWCTVCNFFFESVDDALATAVDVARAGNKGAEDAFEANIFPPNVEDATKAALRAVKHV